VFFFGYGCGCGDFVPVVGGKKNNSEGDGCVMIHIVCIYVYIYIYVRHIYIYIYVRKEVPSFQLFRKIQPFFDGSSKSQTNTMAIDVSFQVYFLDNLQAYQEGESSQLFT